MSALAKSLAVLAVACVVGVMALELGAGLLYRMVRGEGFSRTEVQARLLVDRVGQERDESDDSAELPRDDAVPDQPVILHPYFGFVINPGYRGVNDQGFFRDSPLTRRAPGKLIVLIMGGSVADQVYYLGGSALVEALQSRPEYAAREIQLITTAVGGYKQPQQLLLLSYMMSLGAQYDIVINIDGFNEIDSATDNVMTGINPFYPHTWKLHSQLALNTEQSAALARIEMLREERRNLRHRFSGPILRRSAFALTLWDFLDRARQSRIRQQTVRLEQLIDDEDLPAQVAGPPYVHSNDKDLFEDLADVWSRSSLQMSRLCELYDTTYVHVLQPNQYLPGSKDLTAEEQEVAFDPNFTGPDRIPVAYPMLVERGRRLASRHGVTFVDLTQLYAAEKRTIYNDFCCHVNQLGADLMARAIAAGVPVVPQRRIFYAD